MERVGQKQPAIYKLHKAVFLLNKIADQSLESGLGFGFPQFLILAAINSNPGISQLRVANYLDLTQAAISKQIKGMVDLNLIERDENPDNRREHVLSITAFGKNKLAEANKLLDKKVSEIFFVLNKTEQEQLNVILDRLVGKIYSKGVKYFCSC